MFFLSPGPPGKDHQHQGQQTPDHRDGYTQLGGIVPVFRVAGKEHPHSADQSPGGDGGMGVEHQQAQRNTCPPQRDPRVFLCQQQGQAQHQQRHSHQRQRPAVGQPQQGEGSSRRQQANPQLLGRRPLPLLLYIDHLGLWLRRLRPFPLPHQFIHAHPKQVSQLDDLLQVGHRLAGFPKLRIWIQVNQFCR